jgi:hypothetical protein
MATVNTPTHEILFIACPFQKEPLLRHTHETRNEVL